MPNAEAHYLFRHALLRDAAYQVQLPQDRARLHLLALVTLEAVHGGRPPELPPLEIISMESPRAHPIDELAADLALHARLAAEHGHSTSDTYLHYLRRSAEHCRRTYDAPGALRAWLQLAECTHGDARGAALGRAADAAGDAGNLDLAMQYSRDALSHYTATGNLALQAVGCGQLGSLHHLAGLGEEAERLGHEALARARESGNRGLEAKTLVRLGARFHQSTRYEEAEQVLLQGLAIHRELGFQRGIADALVVLASLYEETRRFSESEELFRQALAVLKELGDRKGEGITLVNLSVLYRVTGRAELAADTARQALAVHSSVGNRRGEAYALGNFAMQLADAGKVREAAEQFGQVTALFREVGDRWGEAVAMSNQGNMLAQLKQTSQALSLLEKANLLLRAAGDRRALARNLCRSAILNVASGSSESAVQAWQEGAGLFEALNNESDLQYYRDALATACGGSLPEWA